MATTGARLPLQTGGAATLSVMSVLGGLPGLLFLAWGITLFRIGWPTAALVLCAIGGALVIAAVVAVPAALARRASDIVISDEHFEIVGGPHHGFRVAFAELGERAVRVERRGKVTELRLRVTGADADRVLARTTDATEAESLANLAEALSSAHAKTPLALPPEAPSCPACSAPVAPSMETSTRCDHCGVTSPTAPAVVRRMQGHQRHRDAMTRGSALVAALMTQPSARAATVRLGVVAAGAALVVLGFIAGEIFLATIGIAETFSLGVSAVFALFTVGVVTVMATRRFADRHALQSLLVVFGARGPARKGEPWRCRGCAAPLPADSSHVVRCVFCDRDNICGAELGRAAEHLGRENVRLETLLDDRTRRARRGALVFWLLAPVTAVAGLVAVFFILLGLEHLAEHDHCGGGEARACLSLAFTYSAEDNLSRDLPRAARFAERGCMLGREADDCCLAKKARDENWGSFLDPVALDARIAAIAVDCW